MKLRNKKTGEIKEGVEISIWIHGEGTRDFPSIVDLNEQWEDYKPKEPLIKDEKIRKAVRAWAKVNGATKLKYHADENSLEDIFRNTISFNRVLDLKDDYLYDIAELCGKEEE